MYTERLRSNQGRDESEEARNLARRRRRSAQHPLALTIEDSLAQGEQRFVSIGMNLFGHLRAVVYTLRDDDARVISARKAEPKEIRAYEKGV